MVNVGGNIPAVKARGHSDLSGILRQEVVQMNTIAAGNEYLDHTCGIGYHAAQALQQGCAILCLKLIDRIDRYVCRIHHGEVQDQRDAFLKRKRADVCFYGFGFLKLPLVDGENALVDCSVLGADGKLPDDAAHYIFGRGPVWLGGRLCAVEVSAWCCGYRDLLRWWCGRAEMVDAGGEDCGFAAPGHAMQDEER